MTFRPETPSVSFIKFSPIFKFNSKHGPFFYTVQYRKCTELIIVPLKFFVQLADCLPKTRPKLILFSNMGRCGSTLLTQMLEAVPGTVTMSEPSFLTGFVSSKWNSELSREVSFSRPEMLAAGLKLQCKALNRPEVVFVVIKTASMMVSLAGDVAR